MGELGRRTRAARSRRGLRRSEAAAAVSAALLLVGCAGVPTSGPVRDERSFPLAPADNDARLLPVTAAAGQSPVEAVRGFLRAADSFDDDHAAARSYLDASDAWRPAGAAVYDDTTGYALRAVRVGAAAAVVELRARRVGDLAADGTWTGAQDERPLVDTYRLVRRGAYWRLLDPPAQLRITTRDLARSYRAAVVYFLTPDRSRVVPDLRYVPVDRERLPTALVRALVAGPSPSLAPAVRTAVVPGTALLGAVPRLDGALRVDLSRQALSADAGGRVALAAQLGWTLRALGVPSVRLLAEGAPLPGAPAPLDPALLDRFDPDGGGGRLAYADLLGRLVRPPGQPVPGPAGAGLLERPVLAPGSGLVAGLRRGQLWAGTSAQPHPVAGTEGALPPAIDGAGRAWTALPDRTGARRLAVVAGGVLRRVPLALPPGPVTRVAVSRDGTRLAVVAHATAYVARVDQTPDGPRPAALRRLSPSLRAVRDLAWADAADLVVLDAARGLPALWVASPDGYRVQSLPAGLPPGASAVAAYRDEVTVAAGGQVLRLVGGRWQLVGTGAAPSYGG